MKKNSGYKIWETLQSVYGYHCIRFSQVTLNPVSGACCTCFLLYSDHCLDREAEDWSRNFQCWLCEIHLLGKSLFTSISFSWKIFQSAPLLTFFFSVFFFSLDVNGNRWPQLVGSFAVTPALYFPAPVWALLLMTTCHWNGGVQKYSGYIYKGPGKI